MLFMMPKSWNTSNRKMTYEIPANRASIQPGDILFNEFLWPLGLSVSQLKSFPV